MFFEIIPVLSTLKELVAPRASLVVWTSALRTHFSYIDSQLFLALLDSLREQAAYAFGPKESPSQNTAGANADKKRSLTPVLDTVFGKSVCLGQEPYFSERAAPLAENLVFSWIDNPTGQD